MSVKPQVITSRSQQPSNIECKHLKTRFLISVEISCKIATMKISLIDQLQSFCDFAWREERVILATTHPKLEPLHLAFMRRAWRTGRVSYTRMLQDTAFSKFVISRAGDYLQRKRLATVKADPRDKRGRHLRLTEKGERLLIEVETALAKRFMGAIGVKEMNSLRLSNFVSFLWDANNLMKHTRVTNPDTYLPWDISPNTVVGPDIEDEIVLLLEPNQRRLHRDLGFD